MFLPSLPGKALKYLKHWKEEADVPTMPDMTIRHCHPEQTGQQYNIVILSEAEGPVHGI